MTDRKTETIDLGKGIQYAKVAARSAEFHRDNESCSIQTECKFEDQHALFTATVTTKKGTFTGHSLGRVGGQQKQFEKLETIAVGRALAFAGYLASGDIACAEEMADVVTTAQLNSLKLKFSKEELTPEQQGKLSRDQKQQCFRDWCKSILGEEVNYSDPQSWDRHWYQVCWQNLSGPSADVPFEE